MYICFPCFYFGLYKYAEEKTEKHFAKWKKVFEEKNIPFELHYKPGSLQDAIFNVDFEKVPRPHCFLIDIENIYVEEVRPRKKAPPSTVAAKTPSGDISCLCVCFDADDAKVEETKDSKKSSKKETSSKSSNKGDD